MVTKWAKIAKGDSHDVDIAVNVAKEAFEKNGLKPNLQKEENYL